MKSILSLAAILLLSVSVISQSGGNFTITKSVIAGGGGRSSGGAFTVTGTIGQSIAGRSSTGSGFTVISGFWATGAAVAPSQDAPFDFDGDGKTDVGIFRPPVGEWWINHSSNQSTFAAQ